jgi:hypothetical protein
MKEWVKQLELGVLVLKRDIVYLSVCYTQRFVLAFIANQTFLFKHIQTGGG